MDNLAVIFAGMAIIGVGLHMFYSFNSKDFKSKDTDLEKKIDAKKTDLVKIDQDIKTVEETEKNRENPEDFWNKRKDN